MSHQWDRGVLNESSWHGLNEIGVFTDAQSMIDHGQESGAWPIDVYFSESVGFTRDGRRVVSPEERNVVAEYRKHDPRILGNIGNRYEITSVSNWNSLCEAAVLAGGKPTGAFSLRDGRTVLATFEVNGRDNGIATNLMLCDTFDGTGKLTVGFTAIRVVCANTLAMALRGDGRGMAMLKHNSTLNQKVEGLKLGIEAALESGKSVREMYEAARTTKVSDELFQKAFDALFPKAKEDASPRGVSRAENARDEATIAMKLEYNSVPELPGPNLAALWNAATWLVDRENNGKARLREGSDQLSSLIFGTRHDRIVEINRVIENALAAA